MASKLYKGLDPLATSAPPVVNNLTSTSTTSALSAYQGKVLNDKFDAPSSYNVVDISAYTVASGNLYVCPNDGYFFLEGSNQILAEGRIYTSDASNYVYFYANWATIVYVKKGAKLCGNNFVRLRFIQFA